MKQEVEAAFAEMLDISTDIDKAVVFGPDGCRRFEHERAGAQAAAVAQAKELARLGRRGAAKMGSQPFTQLVVETPAGFVFLARE